MGDLKFVVPDAEKTFGHLAFAGEGEVVTNRVAGGVLRVASRSFHLFSDTQRADKIMVTIPGSAGEKHFVYDEEVKLVNPRITLRAYSIGDRGYSEFEMTADDLIKASQAEGKETKN